MTAREQRAKKLNQRATRAKPPGNPLVGPRTMNPGAGYATYGPRVGARVPKGHRGPAVGILLPYLGVPPTPIPSCRRVLGGVPRSAMTTGCVTSATVYTRDGVCRRGERAMKTHVHRMRSERGPYAYNGCVAPGNRCRRNPQGGCCYRQVCRCGAERLVNWHNGLCERGEWVRIVLTKKKS